MASGLVAPPKKYRVIYADPPWTFKTYSKKGIGRSAEAHYDCLSIEEICRIPVNEWTTPDALLFLWVTDPLLPRAMEVIQAWGFTYKTVGFYWMKLNKSAQISQLSEKDFFTGLGFWTRANPEMCLLATKGQPKRKSSNVRRLIISPRREHSRKPDETYQRIEQLTDGPYLEMFARRARLGWDGWGNQTVLFNKGSVNTRRIPSDLRKHPLKEI
ncbi:MT-A70 family methyltransferase [Nitrosococcus wardiae]|uniref:DNA methyltransferase n=1 Tax=Nitrosococcus wardiae TaxID=1814290 RepID=A0A4P7BVD4_9GAMM|nr:MT-A70 family methyltransferase [Nitrosococcus wardiae]QBQ53247.1 DNA methyltransferase [Nitrosococcus wardiae]